jgi:hypothetical protein
MLVIIMTMTVSTPDGSVRRTSADAAGASMRLVLTDVATLPRGCAGPGGGLTADQDR